MKKIKQNPRTIKDYRDNVRAVLEPFLNGENGLKPDDLPPEIFGPYADKVRPLLSLSPEQAKERLTPDIMEILAADPLPAWTLDELLGMDFPEPDWVVPDLIPEGLTLIAGAPKVGKSWLCLQLGLALAAGGRFLDRKVNARRALYVSPEHTARDLAARVRSVLAHDPGWSGDPAAFRIMDAPALKDLTPEELMDLAVREGFQVVILDPAMRLWPGADFNDRRDVLRFLDPLQRKAGEEGLSIVMVHHLGKSGKILGSMAWEAVADAVITIKGGPGQERYEVEVWGRLVPVQNMLWSWDHRTGLWGHVGDADEVRTTEKQREIMEALKIHGPMTIYGLAKVLDMNPGTVHRRLKQLFARGFVVREGKRLSLTEKGVAFLSEGGRV